MKSNHAQTYRPGQNSGSDDKQKLAGYPYHPAGSDLDVPGSEFDDEQEKIGNEDEENNYYSLGGDNHNDLDEDNG